jgi:hypothetical protein
MLDELENDPLFGGSPRKKYMDIIFNANQNLVDEYLYQTMRYTATLELMLEEQLGEDKDIEQIAKSYMFENVSKVDERTNDLLIDGMGQILTQNE